MQTRKLLLLLIGLLTSSAMWAQLSVYSRSQNVGSETYGTDVDYGIYSWTSPGDVAAFLSGTYAGNFNGNVGTASEALTTIKNAKFVKFGNSAEPLSQADIVAIFSYFTSAEYIRLDNCVLSGNVDFSQITSASAALKEVTLPSGSTTEQVKAANTALKSQAAGLKLTVAVTGEVVTTTTPHYYYTIPGTSQRQEYTGEVVEGQTSITLNNEEVMVPLTLVEGYPRYSYENPKNDNAVCYFDQTYLDSHKTTIWGSDCFVPSPIDVKLTQHVEDRYYYTENSVEYEIPSTSNSYISYDETNNRYYVNEDYKVWVDALATSHGDSGNGWIANNSEVTKRSVTYYTYTWREGSNEVQHTYEGTVPDADADGNYIVSMENNADGNNGYSFALSGLSPTYKYTYTDLNGSSHVTDESTTPDDDGLIAVYYTGTLDLVTENEVTSTVVPDGMTACVNEGGSLGDAITLLANDADAYKNSQKLTIIGTPNSADLNFTTFTNAKLVDLSGATVSTPADIKLYGQSEVIAPDNTAETSLADFMVTNATTVYSHNGTTLYVLLNNTRPENAEAYQRSGETTLAVRTFGEYETLNGSIETLNGLTHFATLDLAGGKFNSTSDVSLANTTITKLLMANVSFSQEKGGKTLNLSGCTSLVEADLTGLKAEKIVATNMSALKTLTLNDVEGKMADLASDTPTAETAGTVNVTGTYTNAGFAINTDADFIKKRVIPTEAQTAIVGALDIDGFVDKDGCYIQIIDATNKVAKVHATTPGHFAALFAAKGSSFDAGYTFQFDSDCRLNSDDLTALVHDSNNNNLNKYYIDLYDVPATTVMHDSQDIEDVVSAAVDYMRQNNYQAKGLLLPKGVQKVGTGLIRDEAGATTPQATFSEFVAYNSGTSTVVHAYDNADYTSLAGAQASFDHAVTTMNRHSDIATATSVYLVSTNHTDPVNVSALGTTATRVVTSNNDMVKTPSEAVKATAYSAAAGSLAAVVSQTSFANTANLGELNVIGPVNENDIKSLSEHSETNENGFVDGPRVLNLSQATGGVDAMIDQLSSSKVEILVLPGGYDKTVVNATKLSKLTGLHTAISSTDAALVAYVKEAGSLAEARYYATGGTIGATGYITPTEKPLTSVSLSGNLNAADIAGNTAGAKVNADGRWDATLGNNKSSIAFRVSEANSITTIDLKDAVFATQEDMNFSYAGMTAITDVTLPTSSQMTLIPASCFEGIKSLLNLCIPYNYKHIDNSAFFDGYVDHITTTDANGALIDNGPKTYTFSANLEEIGSDPSPDAALATVVFPQNRGVKDVYVLATDVPKCYAGAFPANSLYGWGGFIGGDFPYSREKYKNQDNTDFYFTVLHYPYQGTMSDAEYDAMKKLYTDVNKVYTKKDQTGAVDANGDPIAWPTFAELRRVYNQATAGDQWYDWNVKYDSNNSVNGGNYIPAGDGEYTVVPAGTEPNVKDYSFKGCEGWHQFTLSMANYVAPAEKVEDDYIIREYVQSTSWYTLCIPFNLTTADVVKILGVPKSSGNIKNYLGTTLIGEADDDLIPEVRTLAKVVRKPGTETAPTNEVVFYLTKDLAPGHQYYKIDAADPSNSRPEANTGDIVIRGGYPYLVRPYLPKADVEKSLVKNLGDYIMNRYGKTFLKDASCVNDNDCYEQLGNNNLATSRFAKPYEKHKIQAYLDNGDGSYATHANGNKYFYTFIGQFWQQDLPHYAFYMVNNKWYRYTSGNKGYKWDAYKCIIMASQEVADSYGDASGKYRDDARSTYPKAKVDENNNTVTDAYGDETFDGTLKIGFLDGLNDAVFSGSNLSNCTFMFDDDIMEFDADGSSVTAITTLDGEPLNQSSATTVYNLEGQQVATSLEGLAKGLYIVNGKKFIVK